MLQSVVGSKPTQIGITGGIGAGKSVVTKIFSTLGIPIYDADSRAKALMNSKTELIGEIKNIFGEQAYVKGQLDRSYVAKRAFENKELLNSLNGVVHPAVRMDYGSWIEAHQDASFTLKEAALLFETGQYKDLDKTILVVAPKEMRIKRVVARDAHRAAADVKAIIKNQLSEEEKISLADFIIHNDESQSLIAQSLKTYKAILAEFGG
ncbi:MAG: dephospho-CoA kinase [Cyclobacteriaceae bacterium]